MRLLVITPHLQPDTAPTGVVGVPFVFPAPGAYRIFGQVKSDGTVETAVFDVEVPEG